AAGGGRWSELRAGGSDRWRTACAPARAAMSAQPARTAIEPATGPRRRRNAMPLRAESSLGLVVGDDVARLEPEEIVHTTGAAGRRHGSRAAIVPGRPDHLVAVDREHGTRPVDVRLVEGRVDD